MTDMVGYGTLTLCSQETRLLGVAYVLDLPYILLLLMAVHRRGVGFRTKDNEVNTGIPLFHGRLRFEPDVLMDSSFDHEIESDQDYCLTPPKQTQAPCKPRGYTLRFPPKHRTSPRQCCFKRYYSRCVRGRSTTEGRGCEV